MSKITESAQGEKCQFRIPGVCNFNTDTTVFCHENGSGLGTKWPDTEGGYGCSACHDLIDGRSTYKWDDVHGRESEDVYTRLQIMAMFYEGARRTRLILIEKGLIKLS